MTTQTAAQEQVLALPISAARPAAGSLFFPAGAEDVRQRDLALEFLRWPMILSLPLSVAILTVIGMHSFVAAVPCGVLLATAAVLTAARRACARVTSQSTQATVTALVPKPRAGHGG